MATLNLDIFNNIGLFLKFFNSISDMVYLIKVDGENCYSYMFANDPAKKYTGLTEESFGKSIDEVLPTNAAELIKQKYGKAIQSKSSITYEDKQYIKNPENFTNARKQIRYWDTTVTPVFDEKGSCTHLLAVVRDITDRKVREREIKKIKKRLELVWNSAADAVFTIDRNAEFVEVNNAFTNLLGWTIEELESDKSISIIPEHYKEDIKDVLEKLEMGEVIPYHTVQRITKEENIIDVLSSYSPIYDDDGNWIGAVGMYKDITEQVKYHQQHQKSEERYWLIAEHSSDLIKVIDLEGSVLYASPSHSTILGIDPDYFLNKSILSFIHREDMHNVQLFLEKIVQSSNSASVEIRALTKNGEWVWIESIGTPVLDTDRDVARIVIQARDVTERKDYEDKLKRLALFDHLTNLPNRTYFHEKVNEAMEQAKRTRKLLSVLFLDLDKFKQVNDKMGHDIGDQLLIEFAKRVQSCLSENDILARFAGDEFVILLPDLKKEQAAIDIAYNIIQSLQKEWEIEDHRFITTSSIGVAFYPPYCQSYKELIKNADIALYEAKEQGRNNFKISGVIR